MFLPNVYIGSIRRFYLHPLHYSDRPKDISGRGKDAFYYRSTQGVLLYHFRVVYDIINNILMHNSQTFAVLRWVNKSLSYSKRCVFWNMN